MSKFEKASSMNKSPEIKNIAGAIAKAQSQIEVVGFDSVNPHFKSKYASLTAIVEAIRKPLADNGLSILHSVIEEGQNMRLVSLLLHTSGEWIESTVPIILSKNDMQGIGAAISYSKRFATCSLLNVVSDEDDDGNSIAKTPPRRAEQSAPGAVKVTLPSGAVNKEPVKIGVTPNKLSPDEFITATAFLKGKRIEDLGIAQLEDWATKAEEHAGEKGIDLNTSFQDLGKNYRAVRAQVKALQPSMFDKFGGAEHDVS